jgi:SAM-dependent methyltransferase
VLELGCGAGSFTRRLGHIADSVVAIDIAPSAIERARASAFDPAAIDFRVENIMDYELGAEGPWDLVVMSETIYYLGWLYPLFQVGWLASELFVATRTGGRFLMANTCGTEKDHLLLPWLVRTYRDLFLNVGYSLEAEEVVRGAKHSVEYEILVDLFSKPAEGDRLSSRQLGSRPAGG